MVILVHAAGSLSQNPCWYDKNNLFLLRAVLNSLITAYYMHFHIKHIQVSVKQKYTQKTYVIADLTLPLNVAVTKIVKEAFPLRIYKHTKLPDSMMILPDIKVFKAPLKKHLIFEASVYDSHYFSQKLIIIALDTLNLWYWYALKWKESLYAQNRTVLNIGF